MSACGRSKRRISRTDPLSPLSAASSAQVNQSIRPCAAPDAWPGGGPGPSVGRARMSKRPGWSAGAGRTFRGSTGGAQSVLAETSIRRPPEREILKRDRQDGTGRRPGRIGTMPPAGAERNRPDRQARPGWLPETGAPGADRARRGTTRPRASFGILPRRRQSRQTADRRCAFLYETIGFLHEMTAKPARRARRYWRRRAFAADSAGSGGRRPRSGARLPRGWTTCRRE